MWSPLPRTTLAAALMALAACGDAGEPPARPNVVVVVVDTLRADRTGVYGYEGGTTPALDALAAEGVVFERATAGSSWTVPSMSMLFTGRYTTENVWRVPDGEVSFPERFREAGYRTAGVVSNRLLGFVERVARPGAPRRVYDSGFERGFDHYEVYDPGHPPGAGRVAANGWYADDVVGRGTGWVERTDVADAPYLLWLHMFDPHHPRRPQDPGAAAAFRGPTDDAAYAAWLEGLPEDARARVDREDFLWIVDELAAYDAEVAGVDAALARLFAWLDERGEREQTVVVLTSDHGEGLWQRPLPIGEKPQEHNEVPPLYADHGLTLFDDQVHVPLVLWGPGVGAPRRVATPVSLVDVAPTLFELADLAPPDGGERLSGLSLVGDLSGRSELYAFSSRGSSLTVDGRWRLHLPANHRVERFGLGPELFDLEADPGEVAPVDDAARRDALAARLASFRELFAPAAALSEEEAALRRELLDAMGYTGQ